MTVEGTTNGNSTRPASFPPVPPVPVRAVLVPPVSPFTTVAVPLALQLSGKLPLVMGRVRRVHDIVGTPRAIAFALLGMAGLLASTWKQLVQRLYVGLSGREWLVKAAALFTLLVPAYLGSHRYLVASLVGLGVMIGLAGYLAALVRRR